MQNAWWCLVVAGMFECGWALGLKYTQGFTRLWPSLWTAAAMAVSLWLLSRAMQWIPIGTAYAVWTGIGAVGVAMAGMLFLGEPKTALRIGCLLLIIIGIVGLHLLAGDPPPVR